MAISKLITHLSFDRWAPALMVAALVYPSSLELLAPPARWQGQGPIFMHFSESLQLFGWFGSLLYHALLAAQKSVEQFWMSHPLLGKLRLLCPALLVMLVIYVLFFNAVVVALFAPPASKSSAQSEMWLAANHWMSSVLMFGFSSAIWMVRDRRVRVLLSLMFLLVLLPLVVMIRWSLLCRFDRFGCG